MCKRLRVEGASRTACELGEGDQALRSCWWTEVDALVDPVVLEQRRRDIGEMSFSQCPPHLTITSSVLIT